MMKATFFLLFFHSYLSCLETIFVEDKAPIVVTLEHAITRKQLMWGLMQQRELPPNHGMSFTYPVPHFPSAWMFNCFIDLSIAFLDQDKIIKEIHELKAYPEKMDPKREVTSSQDLLKYSYDDPIVRFFLENGIQSTSVAKYAVEMNKGWFAEHKIQNGDLFWWQLPFLKGYVVNTIDMGPYLPQKIQEGLLFTFEHCGPKSLKFPPYEKPYEVIFLNEEEQILSKRHISNPQENIICASAVKYVIVNYLYK